MQFLLYINYHTDRQTPIIIKQQPVRSLLKPKYIVYATNTYTILKILLKSSVNVNNTH